MNIILQKVEQALESVIDGLSLAANVTVNKGQTDEDISRPYVACVAESIVEEIYPFSNVFRVSASIICCSSADGDDAQSTHETLVGTVFDSIRNTDIATTLSAAVTDFYCYEADATGSTKDVADRAFTDILELSIVCCAQDLV